MCCKYSVNSHFLPFAGVMVLVKYNIVSNTEWCISLFWGSQVYNNEKCYRRTSRDFVTSYRVSDWCDQEAILTYIKSMRKSLVHITKINLQHAARSVICLQKIIKRLKNRFTNILLPSVYRQRRSDKLAMLCLPIRWMTS